MRYNSQITVKKGGLQILNVICSTAFSGLIVITVKEITDQDFNPDTIQEGINNIAGAVLFITPIISAFIRMISNWIKKKDRKL